MLRHKRLPFSRALAALFALALVFALSGTAFASGLPGHSRTGVQQASVNCSGTGCNGKDPYSSGCAATAVLQGTAVAIWNGAVIVGTVQIDWSTQCQTNWAEVRSTAGSSTRQMEAQIVGLSHGIYYWAKCGSGCTAYHSQMYYAPNESVEADGQIIAIATGVSCQTQGSNGCQYDFPPYFPH
jgi:Protein of unknown function (DUF2690)